MAKLMSMAAEEARIDHETNHFARETKTTVKSLSKAGILIDNTIQMRRLESLLGIASYDEQQRRFLRYFDQVSIFYSGKSMNTAFLTAR